VERRIPRVRQDFFRGEQRLEQAGFEEAATFEQIVWDPVWPSSRGPSSPTPRWTASLTAPLDPSWSARASGRQCPEPAEGQAGK